MPARDLTSTEVSTPEKYLLSITCKHHTLLVAATAPFCARSKLPTTISFETLICLHVSVFSYVLKPYRNLYILLWLNFYVSLHDLAEPSGPRLTFGIPGIATGNQGIQETQEKIPEAVGTTHIDDKLVGRTVSLDVRPRLPRLE